MEIYESGGIEEERGYNKEKIGTAEGIHTKRTRKTDHKQQRVYI
jgi:hypothetical protein